MHFLFGNQKKQHKKITNQMTAHVKNSLKAQFCQFCQKALSSKVAFVNAQKHGFTCQNCELTAVCNQVKNLGQKSLVSNQKFSDIVTKSLIGYQTFKQQPNASFKQSENQNKNVLKQMLEISQKIKMQMKRLKTNTHQKMDQLCKQSQKQNNIYVFEEVTKASKDKKASMDEVKNLVMKRSLATKKGIHFVDEDSIQQNNSLIQDRINGVKKQTKIKLKQVEELTQWINSIQIA